MSANEAIFTKEHKEILEKLSEFLTEKKASKALPKLTIPVRRELSEVEKTEQSNRRLEKMIQVFNVLGQFDNYISERVKNTVRAINAVYDMDEKERSRRSRSIV